MANKEKHARDVQGWVQAPVVDETMAFDFAQSLTSSRRARLEERCNKQAVVLDEEAGCSDEQQPMPTTPEILPPIDRIKKYIQQKYENQHSRCLEDFLKDGNVVAALGTLKVRLGPDVTASRQELVKFESSKESLYACTFQESPNCMQYLVRSTRHVNYEPRCKPCHDLARNETRKRSRQEVALKQGRDYADPRSSVSLKACSPEMLAKRARALSKQVKNLERSRNRFKCRVAILEGKLKDYANGIIDLNNASSNSLVEETIVRHPQNPASTSSSRAPTKPVPQVLMYSCVKYGQKSDQDREDSTEHI